MCGCGGQCGQCEHCGGGLLSGLLGDINDPVFPGDRFRFGYNIGYTAGPFIATNVAGVLESEGLAYDAFSYILTGVFNLFISIEGNSVSYWNTALDFRSAIYNAINGAGYPIVAQSVQIDFPQGQGALGPNAIPSPHDVASAPGGGGGGADTSLLPSGKCDFSKMSFPDYLACEFGIGTAGTLIVGGVAVLIAIALIKR